MVVSAPRYLNLVPVCSKTLRRLIEHTRGIRMFAADRLSPHDLDFQGRYIPDMYDLYDLAHVVGWDS